MTAFLLDYHADKTQQDMMCHAQLSCLLMRLAHNRHRNGVGAEHADPVAQNTAREQSLAVLLTWYHLLRLLHLEPDGTKFSLKAQAQYYSSTILWFFFQ